MSPQGGTEALVDALMVSAVLSIRLGCFYSNQLYPAEGRTQPEVISFCCFSSREQLAGAGVGWRDLSRGASRRQLDEFHSEENSKVQNHR